MHLSPADMRAGSWNGPESTACPLFFPPSERSARPASVELRLWVRLCRCSCSMLPSQLLPLQYSRHVESSLEKRDSHQFPL